MDPAPPRYPRITSLSDLQELAENMKRYPIPKLDEASISSLHDALNLFEQNQQGSEIVLGVKFVISTIDCAVQSFTYSLSEWDLIAPRIVQLFRRTLKYMVYNPLFLKDENSVNVIISTTEIMLKLGHRTITLNSLLMENNGMQILRLICWEDLNLRVRRTMLFRFKKFLRELKTSQRRTFVNRKSFPKSSLVHMLTSCGDYEFQEHLTEVLVRFAMSQHGWKNVLKTWFSDVPSVVDAIDILHRSSYEISCRNFLNLVNDSGTLNSRVHSLPCLYADVSRHFVLEKPSGYDELWLDCSPRTAEIQLVVQEDNGKLTRVTVQFADVQSIKCSLATSSHENGEEECCQLSINVHPPLEIPFETPVMFSKLRILLKKDLKFYDLENHFLKGIYANYYEPKRAYTQTARHSSKSSFASSLSSRKSSLANLTYSTIELANSDVGTINAKIPRFSSSLVSHDRKRISTSTPLQSEEKDSTSVRKVRRKVLRNSMESETVGDRKEVDALDVVSTSSGHRTSVSGQVTHFAHTAVKNAGQRVSVQAVELSISLMEEVARHNYHSSENDLETMLTNERITSLQHSEQAQVSHFESDLEAMVTNDKITSLQHSDQAQVSNFESALEAMVTNDKITSLQYSDLSKIERYESDLDAMVTNGVITSLQHSEQAQITHSQNLLPVSSVLIDRSFSVSGHRLGHTGPSATHSSVPEPSTSQLVFGNNGSFVDFKALLPPPPTVKSSSPMMPPSQQPFVKKFFGTRQKPLVEVSESEASISSCSTRISSKRRSGGCVQICSPSLKFNAYATMTKKSLVPKDPFSFVEDKRIGKYERVGAGTKDNSQAPVEKARKRRKLYTPGKDDVLHSNHSDSPSNSSVRKSDVRPVRRNGCSKVKKENCVIDAFIVDNSTNKRSISWNVRAAVNPTRKSARAKKKVNYKEASSSESGFGFAEPCSSENIPLCSSRRVEPLRSENVASSLPGAILAHQAPLGSSLNTVDVDRVLSRFHPESSVNSKMEKNRTVQPDGVVITESHQKRVVAPQCPVVPTVVCTSEATSEKDEVRRQGYEIVRNSDHDYKATKSGVMCVDTPEEAGSPPKETRAFPDVKLPLHATPSSAVHPFSLDTDMLKHNEGKSPSSRAPSHTSQVQMRNNDVGRPSRIGGVNDQIWSEVETCVNLIKSEHSSIIESVKVNLSRCLTTHKDAMKTIKDESSKIARSAAKVQSACEKSMTSFEEVIEMINGIEGGSAVRNDSRAYQLFRQQINNLLN